MVTDKSLNDSFSWGDEVQIKSSAPLQFNPNAYGSVCGLRSIESESIANQFLQPIGTNLYLVEFSNGKAIEIPEIFLKRSE